MKTDQQYELKLAKLRLLIQEIEVVGAVGAQSAAAGSTSSCSFDPSQPPPGCGNCHNGHCHCGDSLISYEELASQLCGDVTSEGDLLASLVVDETLDLLDSDSAPSHLSACEPSCELGAGTITVVQAVVEQLEIGATLRDARQPPRLDKELRLQATLTPEQATIRHALVEPEHLDRDHDYQRKLQLELTVSAALFDGIDWSSVGHDDAMIALDSDTAASEILSHNLINNARLALHGEHEDHHDDEHP